MELKSLTLQVNDAAKAAGEFIKSHFGQVSDHQIEIKDHNSLVSYVDQNAEELLVEKLSEIIPGSGFVTEEDTKDDDSREYVWIIDPLDGTTNFLHNIPQFSTSIALAHNGELIIGVIYDIMADDMYYAWKSGGAFCNAEAIQVNPQKDFSQALIATGFPYEANYNKVPYFNMMEVIMKEARGMRRFGSAALDMAWVACGRFNAFYETSLNPWDVSGGIVICKEAGAAISDYHGGNDYYSGSSTIVGTPAIHEKLLSYTKEFFSDL